MKNIHILPTDKASRLLYNSTLKSFCIQKEIDGMFINDGKVSGANFWGLEKALNNGFQPHNIYITSNEEIKEGDWMIRANEQPIKVIKGFFWDFGIRYYKIILTTDQDLIKDGVQAIDDKFLEWFIKNQSCEYVEVENDYLLWRNSEIEKLSDCYKIIIPCREKEEPKQERSYSEDDLREAYMVGKHGGTTQTHYDFEDWYKHYKK